jgi:hypothetical protein
MNSITTAAVWLLLPLIVLSGVIDWLTESPEQRIRRWKDAGMSQRAIAQRLGISTYRVRKALG